MPASADFLQEYQQAEAAYSQGNFEEAAGLVYTLIENYPEDPSARLLCGHIYGYGLQQYDVAQEQYNAVLSLTDNAELLEQASAAITETSHFTSDTDSQNSAPLSDSTTSDLMDMPETLDHQPEVFSELGESDLGNIASFDSDINSELFDHDSMQPEIQSDLSDSDLDVDTDLKDFEALELSQSDLTLEDLEQDLDLETVELSQPNFGESAEFDDSLNLAETDLTQPDDDDDLETGGSEFDLELEASLAETDLNPYVSDSIALDPLSDNPFDSQTSSITPTNAPSNAIETDEPIDFDDDPFALGDEAIVDEDLEESDLLSGDLFNEAEELDSAQIDTQPDLPTESFEDFDDLFEMPISETDISPPDSPPTQTDLPAASSQSVQLDIDEPTTGELALEEFNDNLNDIFGTVEDAGAEEFDAFATGESDYINGNGKVLDYDSEVEDIQSGLEAETLLTGNSVSPGSSNFDAANRSYLDHTDTTDYATDDDAFAMSVDDDFSEGFEIDPLDSGYLVDDASISVADFSDEFDNSSAYDEENDPSLSPPPTDADDFLDDFEEFDDLGNVPDFEVSASDTSAFLGETTEFDEEVDSNFVATTTSSAIDTDTSSIGSSELFGSLSLDKEAVTTFTPQTEDAVETTISVEQGPLAFLENAPIKTKFFYTAIGAGIASLISVALASNIATQTAVYDRRNEVVSYLRTTGLIMTAVAGISSFSAALVMGRLTSKQMEKASDDLQFQFDAITKNNLKARSTVYAADELGQMSARFNQMAQFIETTTIEAQRKAEEQEEAKENLQRQVIRLLDDVEGAARGDLTVTAEVTADVLGAVADSFNLTIQNLREIVVQVKHAARQVSKGATDSSMFAKDVAGDALRQAEELAATLNSVQVLTDAIQRVADCAREAEEVARSAAAVATKGGESVEMTVAGILKIRETVAETTRDVKRLAESSQEISKIVAIISNIASRTNLLALNASIEAARAGEAGRGFAIVADEVRQLADKSAKSLKEIEQIVMQIQSQTSSVMMAMEEGNQQVIEGTRLAEDAKRSLDDIIQVTNRIDVLVRSITADTVEQNETARAVAQVMQAVEHSAQETSQEAHRVSSALSNLVGVARDLLTSVERFRVDPSERQ
ncbi:MAG: methyl-accepting chemotaxis protein [Microcoleaceae cyanobacterium]